ncbi:DUF2849 domain-containing protein [Pseudaestuariivita sp.]|uniref:DUF2849 domain-containing protein n=1 Tax=Pseudaestuariivita sp. TaxID=2211669 RepID=UPI0040585B05
MPKAFTPKVITANALLEGDVVYRDANGQWVRQLAEAEVLTDEADAELQLLEAQRGTGDVVGVYLADVTPDGTPTHFREEFRRTGPSNYFHGKQAQENAHV